MRSPQATVVNLYTRFMMRGSMERLGDIGAQRAAFDRMAASELSRAPGGDLVETRAGRIPVEWVEVRGAHHLPVVLYLHGGGYCLGSPRTHRGFVRRLGRRTHCRFAVPDYRLAPEHPFPAAVDDALTVYRWVLKKVPTPRHLVIMGDSAGGGLAISTLLAARDANLPMPACMVLMSPWTDLTLSGDSVETNATVDPLLTQADLEMMAARYVPNPQDRRDPLASPLFADLKGLPPTHLDAGSLEVILSDSVRLAERLHAAKVPVDFHVWEGLPHVFQLVPYLPEASQALGRIARFIAHHAQG